jgi:hypothetical protein
MEMLRLSFITRNGFCSLKSKSVKYGNPDKIKWHAASLISVKTSEAIFSL